MKEEWKDIKGFEGLYQVSNKGRIKSLEHFTLQTNIYDKGGKTNRKHEEKILKGWIQNTGYLTVALKNKKYSIHRLVAETFIKNPEKHKTVNHIDGNKLNNKVENLEWCSLQENIKHAYKAGLMENCKRINSKIKQRAKFIDQYDLNGTYIKTFLGSKEAEKELRNKNINISNSGIRDVCNGKRKTAGGFKWKWSKIQRFKKRRVL